jgi:hypothetical protein
MHDVYALQYSEVRGFSGGVPQRPQDLLPGFYDVQSPQHNACQLQRLQAEGVSLRLIALDISARLKTAEKPQRIAAFSPDSVRQLAEAERLVAGR